MKTLPVDDIDMGLAKLIDEIESSNEDLLVTKGGRTIARIVPMHPKEQGSIFGFYKGKIRIVGDIVGPTQTEEETEEYLRREASHLR